MSRANKMIVTLLSFEKRIRRLRRLLFYAFKKKMRRFYQGLEV
jgi:hypothetical protein